VDSAVAGYFRLLLFFSSAVSRIAWSAERICNSESVRSRDLAFESRRTSYCAGAAGAVASGFSPVRRSWRRSWRPCRRSWRWVRRPCRRCIPCVPVASAGAAVVPVASWASASDGSSADDSVRPKAAPSPSSESAFRRDTISVWILSFNCCLPFTHNAETEWRQLNAITSTGTTKVQLRRRRRCGSPFEACSGVRDDSVVCPWVHVATYKRADASACHPTPPVSSMSRTTLQALALSRPLVFPGSIFRLGASQGGPST
jgi:hypothetical protein